MNGLHLPMSTMDAASLHHSMAGSMGYSTDPYLPPHNRYTDPTSLNTTVTQTIPPSTRQDPISPDKTGTQTLPPFFTTGTKNSTSLHTTGTKNPTSLNKTGTWTLSPSKQQEHRPVPLISYKFFLIYDYDMHSGKFEYFQEAEAGEDDLYSSPARCLR